MTNTQTTKTASNNANISTWIDSLTTKRETWENGNYKASKGFPRGNLNNNPLGNPHYTIEQASSRLSPKRSKPQVFR